MVSLPQSHRHFQYRHHFILRPCVLPAQTGQPIPCARLWTDACHSWPCAHFHQTFLWVCGVTSAGVNGAFFTDPIALPIPDKRRQGRCRRTRPLSQRNRGTLLPRSGYIPRPARNVPPCSATRVSFCCRSLRFSGSAAHSVRPIVPAALYLDAAVIEQFSHVG